LTPTELTASTDCPKTCCRWLRQWLLHRAKFGECIHGELLWKCIQELSTCWDKAKFHYAS